MQEPSLLVCLPRTPVWLLLSLVVATHLISAIVWWLSQNPETLDSADLRVIFWGIKTDGLLPTLQDRSRQATVLLGYYSFLWVLPAIVVLLTIAWLFHACLSIGLIGAWDLGGVWQAHAALIGLSFIVFVFLLEEVRRAGYQRRILRRFLASTRAFPVLYFSLGSDAAIALLHGGRLGVLPISFGRDLAALLVLLTVLLIGYVYFRTVQTIFDVPISKFREEEIEYAMEAASRQWPRNGFLENTALEAIENRIDETVEGKTVQIRAGDLGLEGRYLGNIDIPQFRSAIYSEVERLGVEHISLTPSLDMTKRYERNDVVFHIGHNADRKISRELSAELRTAIRASPQPSWADGVALMDENLDWIGDQARRSAEDHDISGLASYLQLYQRLLRLATGGNPMGEDEE